MGYCNVESPCFTHVEDMSDDEVEARACSFLQKDVEWPEEFIVSKTLVVCTSECPFLCTKIQWNPLCHYTLLDYAILKKLSKSANTTSFHFQGQA